MSLPLDYSFCNQTVTLYRRQGDKVTRSVLSKCYFSLEEVYSQDAFGSQVRKKCRLILPGAQKLRSGDRVYPGIGPQVTCWEEFVPANVPGLVTLGWVKTYFWENAPCHTEAGC